MPEAWKRCSIKVDESLSQNLSFLSSFSENTFMCRKNIEGKIFAQEPQKMLDDKYQSIQFLIGIPKRPIFSITSLTIAKK